MRFRNPETGEIFDTIIEALERYCQDHPQELLILMNYDEVEDESSGNPGELEEANMDKPRICEVLGVEVGERFRPKHLCNGFLSIKENGAVEFDGDPSVKDISNLILWLVYHPEDIVRIDGEKTRFTQQEVERAKAIKVLWPCAKAVVKADSGSISVVGAPMVLNTDHFPSIKPKETYTLDEIIGGADHA